MERLTDADLQAIKERAERATAGPWESVEIKGRTFVKDSEDFTVCETYAINCDGNTEFIAHALKDVLYLLSVIDVYRDIIFEIGRLHELLDHTHKEEDVTEIIDKLFEVETMCKEMYRQERILEGFSLCEDCLEEYAADSSPEETLCNNCVSRLEMEMHGWEGDTCDENID